MVELKRVLRLRTLVSTGSGFAMATITYGSFILLAGYLTGDSSWIAILTAGIFAIFSSLCFSEMCGMFPSAAGIKLYIERAFNEKIALCLASIYIIAQISAIGAESYILGHVIAKGIPVVPPIIWAILFLVIIALFNIRGIRIAGLAQDITAYTMFSFLIIVSVYAISRSSHPPRAFFQIGSFDGFLQAVAVGISLYIGFEWVTTMAEEVTDSKMIPKGMMLAVGLLCLTYSLFSVAMTSTVPKQLLASETEGAVPHIVFAREFLGNRWIILFIIASITASLTSFNAGLMTTSRFIYAMSRDRALPRIVSRLHPRYATPWISILLMFLFAVSLIAVVFATSRWAVFVFIIASAECAIYMSTALSVIKLRRKDPSRERPFRIPGGFIIPSIVVIIYGLLLIALLAAPDPNSRYALVFMGGLSAVVVMYVIIVVPRLRSRYAIQDAQRRRRRRPSRSSGNSPSRPSSA
jgi:amino acid transporter